MNRIDLYLDAGTGPTQIMSVVYHSRVDQDCLPEAPMADVTTDSTRQSVKQVLAEHTAR